jgi:hypothetical protein
MIEGYEPISIGARGMSDLTFFEKAKLEKLLEMGGGFVLDFSNNTFRQFVAESVGRDIYESNYNHSTGSKANRLRGFWKAEPNHLVGKLLNDLIRYADENSYNSPDRNLVDECKRIAARLSQGMPVDALDAIKAETSEPGFEALARAVRESIENNEPEAGLDRLHTYVTKLIRTLAEKRGVVILRDKPLHSTFGEYVKKLRQSGEIESLMAERILKSSISTFEAFNKVRNDRSLAHDNPTLGYDESLLIYNHVCSTIRYVRTLEEAADRRREAEQQRSKDEELWPF